MSLSKSALATSIKDVFRRAMEEGWTSEQVGDALADAIDAYVRAADVTGVTVEVRSPSNTVIGTGQQTGAGRLQ